MKYAIVFLLVMIIPGLPDAQTLKFGNHAFTACNVKMAPAKINNKNALKIIKDSSIQKFDEPTFARLSDMNFANGIIEIKVLSRLLKTAPDFARGFIGIAFRINDSNTIYESIYLRPLNARANDQVRRNHSIQYYAYPDYKFDILRKTEPEKYESYTDMEMDNWIDIRIEVKGREAKLFLNNSNQPSLVVNDLKHGADSSGAIGLWVDVGTEGYFRDLKIKKTD